MTLRAEGLIKVYYDRMTVKGVSIDISEGEIVGLLGANGAGKTTTFYMIAGLIPPTEGEVYLEDKKITNLPLYERARKGIGYLPQEASVFRQLSVEDNIMAVLEFTKLSKKERNFKKEQLIDEFGLSHVRKNKGNILSGGERRRTEIARALATDPTFLLLDEPFAGVDPIAVEEIQDILKKLKEKNLGILITDHNVDETLAITDRSYLMFEGSVLKKGTAEELAKDEKVKKVYLGKKFILKSKRFEDNIIDKTKSIVEKAVKKIKTKKETKKLQPKSFPKPKKEKTFLDTIFSLFTPNTKKSITKTTNSSPETKITKIGETELKKISTGKKTTIKKLTEVSEIPTKKKNTVKKTAEVKSGEEPEKKVQKKIKTQETKARETKTKETNAKSVKPKKTKSE